MICYYMCLCVYLYVCVCSDTRSCLTFCNPLDCSLLLCLWDSSRQEYWSVFLFPPSGDLPDPEIDLVSLMSTTLAGVSLPLA